MTRMVRGIFEKHNTSAIDISALLLHPDPTRPISRSYKVEGRLGAGSFGCVYKATALSGGETRAVKVISKKNVKCDMKFIMVEVEAMVKLQHPNILKFYEYFEDGGAIYLVCELCSGGDLAELNRHSTGPEELRSLFRDVTLGVSYCHNLGIAHRDLKFENVMLTEPRPEEQGRKMAKIIDFGLAAIRREKEADRWAREALGTKYFVAPEVLQREPLYGVKCDVWSLGVMFYILLTDEHPMSDKAADIGTNQLFKMVRDGKVRREPLRKAKVPEEAEKLLLDMLVRTPDADPRDKSSTGRPSAMECLAYPYLNPESSLTEFKDVCNSKEMGKRLASFGARSRFEKVVLMLTAHQAAQDRVKKFKDAFISLDRNGNGKLSKDELKKGLSSIPQAAGKGFEQMFLSLDTNHDDAVEYIEWLTGTLEPSLVATEKVLRDLFSFFDADADGKVCFSELAGLMGDDEARQVISEGDSTGDERLDHEEFKAMMMKIKWDCGAPPGSA